MKIEELRLFAKERGVSDKRIDALIAELHPDENGELSLQESGEAIFCVDYIADSRDFVKWCLEETKAIRQRHGKQKPGSSFSGNVSGTEEGE